MSRPTDATRRAFLKITAAAAASPLLAQSLAGRASAAGDMPYRPLGGTGERVSLLGIGGAHLGYDHVPEPEATSIMHAAIDAGVNFFDNSWDYNRGLSEARMGRALAMDGKRKHVFLMTKFCCHRDDRWNKAAALDMLDESLKRLRTDYLDLWQLHEVVRPDHPAKAFRPDSAAEAMLAAKQAGKVRYIGFTGHRDPAIHLDMLARDYPYDTVQLPLNVLDAHFRSFERQVLPVLQRRHIGAIGMKPLGGGSRTAAILETRVASALECLHYAMNLPVATVIVGLISRQTLDEALQAARSFRPLRPEQVSALLARTREVASEGRHEQYKS